jgi:CheY-like chemotaxis protein
MGFKRYINIPHMHGLIVFQALQNPPTTRYFPVILIVAKVETQDFNQFEQLNFAGVIAKLFDL